MAEEFQESDVVFSEHYSCHHTSKISTKTQLITNKTNKKHNRKTGPTTGNSSPPMSIPETGIRWFEVAENSYDDHDDDDQDDQGVNDEDAMGGERIPPHLIVARRVGNLGREMACSFYVEDGNGRILKGKNLCQVRNSILRLTGFIET